MGNKAWEEHVAGCTGQCSGCSCSHEGEVCTCTQTLMWEETPLGRVKRFFPGPCEVYEPEPGQHERCGPGEDYDSGSE